MKTNNPWKLTRDTNTSLRRHLHSLALLRQRTGVHWGPVFLHRIPTVQTPSPWSRHGVSPRKSSFKIPNWNQEDCSLLGQALEATFQISEREIQFFLALGPFQTAGAWCYKGKPLKEDYSPGQCRYKIIPASQKFLLDTAIYQDAVKI